MKNAKMSIIEHLNNQSSMFFKHIFSTSMIDFELSIFHFWHNINHSICHFHFSFLNTFFIFHFWSLGLAGSQSYGTARAWRLDHLMVDEDRKRASSQRPGKNAYEYICTCIFRYIYISVQMDVSLVRATCTQLGFCSAAICFALSSCSAVSSLQAGVQSRLRTQLGICSAYIRFELGFRSAV